jgi:hypothetical protein
MIKSKLIATTLEKSDLPSMIIEELTIIIEAWESIDFTEDEIIDELKNYIEYEKIRRCKNRKGTEAFRASD